jgi:hypothetical protein
MDKNTETLIRELADKLGTTSEYLWGVLLKQAPISAATDAAAVIILLAVTFYVCRLVFKKTTTPPKTEDEPYPEPEWEEAEAFLAWVVAGCSVVGTTIFVTASIQSVVTALLNPEYWALQQLMH